MKHHLVAKLVKEAYTNSNQEFGNWMCSNHLQYVAHKTQELSIKFGADQDLAIAGAWLHDFGDAFVHRHAESREEVSIVEAKKILKKAEYTDVEIDTILNIIIAPHSCKENNLPTTLEGKVLATADALAHLNTDFYIQFCWKHLPDNKNYSQFMEWVNEKLDRDFNKKIFFEEIKQETKNRYLALMEVFGRPQNLTEKMLSQAENKINSGNVSKAFNNADDFLKALKN